MRLLPAGKWWGPSEVQPILALHGRQDNAGSFDTLMPLLSDDVSILCLDMPGHGLSSHYPKSQFYYVYWDGVIFLRRIIKHFKWNKVSEWINLPTLFIIEINMKIFCNNVTLMFLTASHISNSHPCLHLNYIYVSFKRTA